MKIEFELNGKIKKFDISPGEILLDTLRNHGYYGAKRGCDHGDCGACAILVDGRPINSCMILTAKVDGSKVTTIEGLGSMSKPHPLQTSFVEKGAVQCGFCIPGMILSASYLIEKHPDPTDEQIKDYLDGNLCRCTGYVKQIEAVKDAARKMRSRKKKPARLSGRR